MKSEIPQFINDVTIDGADGIGAASRELSIPYKADSDVTALYNTALKYRTSTSSKEAFFV